MRDYLVAVLFISGLAPGLSAQTLAQRVAEVEEGTVRLSFAARPGVCGDWKNGITMRHESDEWQADCGSQAVLVALRVRDHRVYSVRTYVGGRWLPDRWSTDLGTVPAREAADYFIGLAERSGDGKSGAIPSSRRHWPTASSSGLRSYALPERPDIQGDALPGGFLAQPGRRRGGGRGAGFDRG